MNRTYRRFERERKTLRADLNLGWREFKDWFGLGTTSFHLSGGQPSAGCFALVKIGRNRVRIAYRSAEMYQRGHRPRLRSLAPKRFWREFDAYHYPPTPTVHQRLGEIAARGRAEGKKENAFEFVGIPQ